MQGRPNLRARPTPLFIDPSCLAGGKGEAAEEGGGGDGSRAAPSAAPAGARKRRSGPARRVTPSTAREAGRTGWGPWGGAAGRGVSLTPALGQFWRLGSLGENGWRALASLGDAGEFLSLSQFQPRRL